MCSGNLRVLAGKPTAHWCPLWVAHFRGLDATHTHPGVTELPLGCALGLERLGLEAI
jgi:hypothetical protein